MMICDNKGCTRDPLRQRVWVCEDSKEPRWPATVDLCTVCLEKFEHKIRTLISGMKDGSKPLPSISHTHRLEERGYPNTKGYKG